MRKVQEQVGLQLVGRWRDTIIHADGTRTEGEWTPNQIQNGAPVLAAALFRRASETEALSSPAFTGFKYLAVGRGDVSWDGEAPVKPRSQADLTDEFFRKAIPLAAISFLDPDDEDFPVVAGPTRMLQVEMTLLPGEANDALREFGLFCGQATAVKDSGIMFNWVVHPLINKDSTLTIIRTIQITFLLPT